MTIASTLQYLRGSFAGSAGTIVFGMEDGTVSIFGLIFGVAATTTNSKAVLIAGASGAVAAAVSMMAGAYLDVETTRDEIDAKRALADAGGVAASLSSRLTKAGLTPEQSAALTGAVQHDRTALGGLLQALQGAPETPLNPREQALWMLLADFLAAAVPILPFVFLAVPQARLVSAVVTLGLLVVLGYGRADRKTQQVPHGHRDGFDRHCRGAGGRPDQRRDRSLVHRLTPEPCACPAAKSCEKDFYGGQRRQNNSVASPRRTERPWLGAAADTP